MARIAALGLYVFHASGFVGQTAQPKLKATMALEDCRVYFGAGNLCHFGNKSAPQTIVIYGDSHAEHLTTAFNETLGKR
jgi:hypothetical protein